MFLHAVSELKSRLNSNEAEREFLRVESLVLVYMNYSFTLSESRAPSKNLNICSNFSSFDVEFFFSLGQGLTCFRLYFFFCTDMSILHCKCELNLLGQYF